MATVTTLDTNDHGDTLDQENKQNAPEVTRLSATDRPLVSTNVETIAFNLCRYSKRASQTGRMIRRSLNINLNDEITRFLLVAPYEATVKKKKKVVWISAIS